jgi:hypothetical protein
MRTRGRVRRLPNLGTDSSALKRPTQAFLRSIAVNKAVPAVA